MKRDTMMSGKRSRVLGLLVAPLMLGTTGASGCDVEGQPLLRLSDASSGGCSGEEDLKRPVAVGARLDVNVRRDGDAVEVVDIFVDDAVFEVESPGNPIGLRAVAPGVTELVVFDDLMTRGAADLEVREIASAAVSGWALTPYNFDSALEEPNPEGRDALVAEGYALLPDGELRLTVDLMDESGATLGGYGAAGWTSDEAMVTLAAAEARSDDVLVTPAGGTGTTTITTVAGGSFVVTLLGADDPLSVDVYQPGTGVRGGPIDVGVGETVVAVGVVFDADGRFVVGDGPATATLDQGIVAIVPPPWGDEIVVDAELAALLVSERVLHLEGIEAGTTLLHLSLAGVTIDVPVEVHAE